MRAKAICLMLAGAIAVAGCAAPAQPASPTPQSTAPPASTNTAVPPTPAPAPLESPILKSPLQPTQSPAGRNADAAPLPAPFMQTQLQFAFDVLNQAADADAEQNIFVSAPNIALALAIAANGAKGETFDALAAPLSGNGATLAQMNSDFVGLQALLKQNSAGITLTLANSLWVNAGPPLNDDYLQRAQQFYDATIRELDFAQPGSADEINRWVQGATNGKIPGIVDQLQPDLVLMIVSAIYFKAAWLRPFQPEMTEDQPFTPASGSPITVPMMQQSGFFSHLKNEQFEAVYLPYSGNTARMVVLLPAAGSSVDALRRQLTPQNWQSWSAAFAPAQGSLRLPRFKTEFEIILNDALKNIGMDVAFDAQRADFSGMRPTPPNLFISEVKHRSMIDVNEAGTEAAAVTSVSMGVTSAQPSEEEPFEMIVDRPFLFAIEDTQTGALLFQGIIRQP
jgi:serpin B